MQKAGQKGRASGKGRPLTSLENVLVYLETSRPSSPNRHLEEAARITGLLLPDRHRAEFAASRGSFLRQGANQLAQGRKVSPPSASTAFKATDRLPAPFKTSPAGSGMTASRVAPLTAPAMQAGQSQTQEQLNRIGGFSKLGRRPVAIVRNGPRERTWSAHHFRAFV